MLASIGHIAVGMLAGRALTKRGAGGIGQATVPMLLCSGLALLPDLDYLGVMLGIADAGPCGHRGATHSLIPAVVVSLVAAVVAPRFALSRWRTAAICGLAVASHALLDAMTFSSRGVPLLWPLSFVRFEMPWRPIPNAPCGLAYLSREGLRVASVELLQFSPILLFSVWPALSRLGQAFKAAVRTQNAAPTTAPPATSKMTHPAT